MTPAPPDPLTAQLVGDLRRTGLRVPADIAEQLASVQKPDADIDPGL